MAKSSSYYFQDSQEALDRVNLGSSEETIEGGAVCWVINDATIATVNVRDFDITRLGEYRYGRAPEKKPHIIIKCAADCSSNNVAIKNSSGSTLYTFNTDCSSTPAYIVLGITEGTRVWKLA